MDEALAMRLIPSKLDDHWRNYQYCSVDIETTGLDLKNDEVISIGAVTITDGRFKQEGNFYEEISPTKSPSVASMQIHGLRGIDLENAHPAQVVVPKLVDYMQGKYLIAHAGWIEKAFLSNHFKSTGNTFPRKAIDTAGLARFAGFAESENGHEPSLEHLARTLNLPVFTPHHALGDAMTTGAVFLALAAKIERNQMAASGVKLTLHQLLEYSQKKK